ncbi:polyprenyl synthetase family protein [Microbacterium sp. NPDC089189]|uniref:polyprenyl synthetase family protein n=1 Tax=Microbacterium sp. NPDC089189 TaxID=3154972 RepID=UPI0034441887
MIDALSPAVRAGIDDAVDGALARIRDRARGLGEGFDVLAAAVTRAASGGKRFRPANVVAAYQAFDGRDEGLPAVYQVAAAFELLHAAFVVHDDVIDHDLERRGAPNIAGEFEVRGAALGADATGRSDLGTAAAILGGDLLLYEATRLIALADVPSTVRASLMGLFDDAVTVSAAGELADVENALGAGDLGADDVLTTAHDKTAVYSFDAPLRAGAMLAGADDAVLTALSVSGGRLGLAFQLVDDLIGAFGTTVQTGRDVGVDLRAAKRTPLISLARQSPTWDAVSEALAVAHTGPVAVLQAQRVLDASGARERLATLIAGTLDAARTAASDLPEPAHRLIDQLAVRIGERIP